MKHQDKNLIKQLEEFEANAKNINEIVEVYKNIIRELQSQKVLTELAVTQAEERARSAEKLAQQANNKYQKAIELQTGQYQQLIHDLFEEPKIKLESSMRKQSNISNIITMSIATLSIVISLLFSIYFQNESSRSMSKLIAKMEESSNSVNDLITKMDRSAAQTDIVIENIWSNDPAIKKLVLLISQEGKNFSNYQTHNDLALVYKMRMSDKTPNTKYSDFIKAFRVAGINKKIIPSSEDELRRWDTEYLELCKKAVDILRGKNPNEAASDVERRFATYEIVGDETDYSLWEWKDLTYGEVLDRFQEELDIVQKRINFNK